MGFISFYSVAAQDVVVQCDLNKPVTVTKTQAGALIVNFHKARLQVIANRCMIWNSL